MSKNKRLNWLNQPKMFSVGYLTTQIYNCAKCGKRIQPNSYVLIDEENNTVSHQAGECEN